MSFLALVRSLHFRVSWEGMVLFMSSFVKHLATEEKGFTLIELLIVVALLAIVATISAPRIGTYMATADFRADARRLVGALKTARMEAVKRNGDCSLSFLTINGVSGYLVYVDNNSDLVFDVPADVSNIQPGEDEPIIYDFDPNDGTTIVPKSFDNALILAGDNNMVVNANGEPSVRFNSRGLPFNSGGSPSFKTITLSASADRSKAQQTGIKRNVTYNRLGRIRIE
jgi:type IV fimbrial biogenesis protein FimT